MNIYNIFETKKGLYYNVNQRKKAGTSRSKNAPEAPSAEDWKNAAKTAKEDINEGIEIVYELSEGAGQQLSVQQLAAISDAALDSAYGYGRSTPGNTFGWQANLASAAYAKQMIDRGETDVEAISDAVHKGWWSVAQKFVDNPDQFSDTEKLRANGKFDKKMADRKAQMVPFNQLTKDQQDIDTVVARAMLQAITGEQGVTEGWKDAVVGGAMALGALGVGNAQAADLSNYNTQYLQQVVSGEHQRPMVSIDDAKAELQARANGKQQSVTTPAKSEEPKGFSKEYLQKAADPNRFGRYLISVEKAQELLSKMQEGVAEGQYEIHHLDPEGRRKAIYHHGIEYTDDVIRKDADYHQKRNPKDTIKVFKDKKPMESQGVEESLRPGEYHVWTVHFEDGTKGRIRVPNDEITDDQIKAHYAKRGKTVVKVDADWAVHSLDEAPVSNFMTAPQQPIDPREQWKRQVRAMAAQYQRNPSMLASLAKEAGPDSVEQVAWEYLQSAAKGIRMPGADTQPAPVNWDDVIRRLPQGLSGQALLNAAEEYLTGTKGMLRSQVRTLLNEPTNQRSLKGAYDRKLQPSESIDELAEAIDSRLYAMKLAGYDIL